MTRTTPADQERLRATAADPGPFPLTQAIIRAILDLQDQVKPQPEIYGKPVFVQALQNEIYDLSRRIVGQAETIKSLQDQLLKAHQGWEQAGRESALNLALAQEAAKKGYRGASAGSRTDWHPL